MKKVCVLVVLLVLALCSPVLADMKSKAVDSQGDWTDGLMIYGNGTWGVNDTNSLVATVKLQCWDPSSQAWQDTGDTATAEGIWKIEIGSNMVCRVGVDTGGYVSGDGKVWIQNK